MARYRQRKLELSAELRPEELPRFITKIQAAHIHEQYFAPISPRTLAERWPLRWRLINGKSVVSTREFLAEAQRRFDAAAVIIGGLGSDQEMHA